MAKVLFKNVNVLDCSGAPPFAGQDCPQAWNVVRYQMEKRWLGRKT